MGGTRGETVVEEPLVEFWGEVGWEADGRQKEVVIFNLPVRPCNFQIAPPASPGAPPGGVQSAVACTIPALSEGLEGPGLDQGAPQGGQETQEAISGAIFDPQSIIFGPPWRFGELDKLLKTILLQYSWYQELSFSTTPHARRGRRISWPEATCADPGEKKSGRQVHLSTEWSIFRETLRS